MHAHTHAEDRGVFLYIILSLHLILPVSFCVHIHVCLCQCLCLCMCVSLDPFQLGLLIGYGYLICKSQTWLFWKSSMNTWPLNYLCNSAMLFLETRSLTEVEACCFLYSDWPVGSQNLPSPFPQPMPLVTGTQRHTGLYVDTSGHNPSLQACTARAISPESSH